jgi:uncharacterized protein YyaL (SSP411 family)
VAHKHTNALINETSPYLLQHAHNPVDWHPWGEAALQLARERNVPIFLSIGYAACHWCHVMEHESFENEEVAAILNEHYVAIKVDREERPDLDEIYMNATVMFTRGHGGWPMSVWLTPEGKPFFGGTYFPPEDWQNRPGFKSVLLQLVRLWKERERDILNDADKVVGILQKMGGPKAGNLTAEDAEETEERAEELLPEGQLRLLALEGVTQAAGQIVRAMDARHGGLASGSNKFPPSMAIELILRCLPHWGTVEDEGVDKSPALERVTLTLDRMARGGIYDHLGGGMARYSTDPQWLVPHFEKMLYDQALVVGAYLDAYQVTGRADFAATARGICNYVLRDLQHAEGGFYSSEDADSEGQEGKFYIWTYEQVADALGETEAALFAKCYDVTALGNWEHPGDAHVPEGPKNILRLLKPLDELARQMGLAERELVWRLGESREKLLKVRNQRVRPGLDDKILTAWNGLMIASLARACAVLSEPRYLTAAERAADFILRNMQVEVPHNGGTERRLLRSHRAGKSQLMAYADDYTFFIDALTTLYETTGNLRWLAEAERLLDICMAHYWDRNEGALFFTADDHERLIVRSKLATDNATPSANSVMAMNLMRLRLLLGRNELHRPAAEILAAFSRKAAQQPFAHERLLSGLEMFHATMSEGPNSLVEIAVIGPTDDERTHELIRVVHGSYRPNKVVALLDPRWPGADKIGNAVPLLAGKSMLHDQPTAYVCRNYTCQSPVNEARALVQQLARG